MFRSKQMTAETISAKATQLELFVNLFMSLPRSNDFSTKEGKKKNKQQKKTDRPKINQGNLKPL